MTDKTDKQKKQCCAVHPMYDTVICVKEEEHEGLHICFFMQEDLRWGIPSQDEMYNVRRTK